MVMYESIIYQDLELLHFHDITPVSGAQDSLEIASLAPISPPNHITPH